MNRRDNRPNRHRQNHPAPRKSGNRETHSRTQRERNSNRGKSFQGKDNLGGDHVEGRQAVRELLLGGKRRLASTLVNGVTLEHDASGSTDADAVLLMRGTNGTKSQWEGPHRNMVSALTAAGFRCITFDARDMGLS